MSNKDYFSLFMDFRETPTLAMLQSVLNTLYKCASSLSMHVDINSASMADYTIGSSSNAFPPTETALNPEFLKT
jgi:hypothetical protein